MKNAGTSFFTIVMAVVMSLGAVHLLGPKSSSSFVQVDKQETPYERVMRTGVIRCGFAPWEPILIVDPGTREISGIAHGVIEAAAEILNLKVEWTEEVGWGEYVTSLSNNRFDTFCAGPTPNTERASKLIFTDPFVFSRISLFARVDDARFDNNAEKINNLETRFSLIDGTTSLKVIRETFPKATIQSNAELVPFSQLFDDVAYNKADITLEAMFNAHNYIESNPGRLKPIPGFENFRVMANVFMVDNDAFKLRELLNEAIDELRVSGKLDQIIDRYEQAPNLFYRIADPYQTTE